MKKTIKKYFIPHEENNFHPHILHTKRTFFYSGVFIVLKAIVFFFVLALPEPAFVLPDILSIEKNKIVAMANDLRKEKGIAPLEFEKKLNTSAYLKAKDMADEGYFSHTTPDGKGLKYFLVLADYKYKVAGENLAMGYSDTNELFEAWLKSPTHYNNIVDSDFNETGIGVQAGSYNEIPTVYVAQHFGRPKIENELRVESLDLEDKTDADSEPVVLSDKVVEEKENIENISEEKNSNVKEIKYAPVILDAGNSKLFWEKEEEGMKLLARVLMSGDVNKAFVQIKEYSIPLEKIADNVYEGEISLQENKDDFFKAIVPGTIIIQAKNGEIIKEGVAWGNAEIVEPTPIEKYTMAKKRLSPITNIFDISKNIYLGFLIFFAFALILNIVIEIRKQHHHVILQTLGLLLVLTLFYTF